VSAARKKRHGYVVGGLCRCQRPELIAGGGPYGLDRCGSCGRLLLPPSPAEVSSVAGPGNAGSRISGEGSR
jgi:hypothetical protein